MALLTIAVASMVFWKDKSARRAELRYGPMRPLGKDRSFLAPPIRINLDAFPPTRPESFAVIPSPRPWGPR
jgi:hypothetical protein